MIIIKGHFYFTQLLLPILLETAKSSPDKHVRVVTTSSSGHMFFGPAMKLDTLRDSASRRKHSPGSLYAQSKLGNVLITRELAKRYGDQGIVATSLNPGNLKTELQRHANSIQRTIIVRL